MFLNKGKKMFKKLMCLFSRESTREINFKYKSYEEWFRKNENLRSMNGYAYPIVKMAFEAGRTLK